MILAGPVGRTLVEYGAFVNFEHDWSDDAAQHHVGCVPAIHDVGGELGVRVAG